MFDVLWKSAFIGALLGVTVGFFKSQKSEVALTFDEGFESALRKLCTPTTPPPLP